VNADRMSHEQLAEIQSLDLLAMMPEKSAAIVSGHLAALLAEVQRMRSSRWDATQVTAELESRLHAMHAELTRARARVAELEAELTDAVAVSETLYQRLTDEKLASSALYAALTMPTTPEQRQAALDRFLAVAQRTGQLHGPSATPTIDRSGEAP